METILSALIGGGFGLFGLFVGRMWRNQDRKMAKRSSLDQDTDRQLAELHELVTTIRTENADQHAEAARDRLILHGKVDTHRAYVEAKVESIDQRLQRIEKRQDWMVAGAQRYSGWPAE